MPKKVAYIMSRFPHLPETFILREMMEVEKQGISVALYPLIVQRQSVIHPEAAAWLGRAHRLPWISQEILAANGRAFFKKPLRYLSLFWRVFWGNLPSPKFLARALALFPKTVRMAEMMQAEGIDHIHAHYATHPALAAWLIHHLTGIPYSFTVHAHDIYVDRTMLAAKVRDADFVAAISQFNRQFLAQHLGEWTLTKTHVIHCGIQPERYQPAPKKTGGRFELLSIGSLQPYKGQIYLLEACALLMARGLDFRCRIVGGGELAPELEERIHALGLEQRVILAGAQTQQAVAQMLSEADCYLQPSIITPSGKMEGIPVSIMEALACALPVVASDISGISELVRPGQTGWLVPQKNPAALAQAIWEVWQQPEEAARRARAGRELALREFGISENIRLLSLLLNKSVRSII
ncbi:MAG: glycosyltransferase family 4 protein [Anaerolineales bacterium]